MKLAKDRSNDVSEAVIARINFEYDLIASDAKYYDSCYKSFLRPNTGGKIGRPQNEEPIQTLLPPAPEKLLNTIFCNCKKGCSAKCGCRKVGLECSPACTNCQGQSCSNVQMNTTEGDSCDFDEETTDSSSFEQFMNIQREEEEEEIGEDMIIEFEYEEYESD